MLHFLFFWLSIQFTCNPEPGTLEYKLNFSARSLQSPASQVFQAIIGALQPETPTVAVRTPELLPNMHPLMWYEGRMHRDGAPCDPVSSDAAHTLAAVAVATTTLTLTTVAVTTAALTLTAVAVAARCHAKPQHRAWPRRRS